MFSLKLLSVPESLKLLRKPPELKRWCLDPLEGLSEAGRNNGDDYLKIMTRNIDNLELALGVK